MARTFTRRGVLGAGAAAVAGSLVGPFLRQAFAQTARPARVVIVIEGNGIYPVAFLSQAARTAIDAQASAPVGTRLTIHQTYGHAQPIVVPGSALSTAPALGALSASGSAPSLEGRAAVVLGLSSTITGGGHSTEQGALSCARGSAHETAAATIDAVLAARLQRGTPFEAVRLGVTALPAALVYQTCAFGPGKPAPIVTNPTLAFSNLFGPMLGGATQQLSRDRAALLDFARDDVRAALATFGGGSTERFKLERYLEAVEALRARQALLVQLGPSVRPLIPPGPGVDARYASTDPLEWLAAEFDLAKAALLGGLTNVVVLASGTSTQGFNLSYPSLISGIARHDLHHGIQAPAYAQAVMGATRRHVELIAALARSLAATPEVGATGSMLDHTAIVYLSDNGEQHHSTAQEWPMLLVGGDRLGLHTDGRTVVFPGYGRPTNRQVSNLFNTLGHATGDSSLNTFGLEGPTRIAPGPLSELYTPV